MPVTAAPFFVLRYGRADPDSLMDAVVPEGLPLRRLTSFTLRVRSYPETRARAQESVRHARRQPRGALHRWLKRRLYAAQYNAFRARLEAAPGAVAVVWNGLTGTRLVLAAAARDAGRGCLFVERAPLPGRITVDPDGVNAVSSLPRAPSFYADWAAATPPPPSPGWRRLGDALVPRAARRGRGGIGQDAATAELARRPYLFCPLQVPDDTQVTRFAGWCGGMTGFLAALSDAVAALPDGWHLRLKEHPSSKRSLGDALDALRGRHGDRVIVDNATDTFAQVAASHGVVTLNSSVGLQAFFHDKPVIVLGEALFRIPGIVHPVAGPSDLAALFARPAALGFDAALRDAFMRYLDEVYYPAVTYGADGVPRIDADRLGPKIDVARSRSAGRADAASETAS